MIYINPYNFGGFLNRYFMRMDAVNEHLLRSGFSLNGFTQFTVSIWLTSVSASASVNYIFSFPENSAGSNGCDLYQLGSGASSELRATVRTSSGITVATGMAINDGIRHNILLWYDGVNARIYVDDVQRGTVAKTGTVSLTANQTNFNRFGTFGSHYGGDFDEMSIWNIGLDATGRTAIYNGGTPGNLATHPNAGNRVAWYRADDALDDMTGTTGTIRDQVGSNHLTPVNTEAADKVLY